MTSSFNEYCGCFVIAGNGWKLWYVC